jgi:rhodanese-related sulfurtransferase
MGPKVDLSDVIAKGATIVDVRTKAEYAEGHIHGSLHIPLDQLSQNLNKLPKGKPVITVCRSGARSGMAVDVLKGEGYEAYNGGPWTSLNELMKK